MEVMSDPLAWVNTHTESKSTGDKPAAKQSPLYYILLFSPVPAPFNIDIEA